MLLDVDFEPDSVDGLLEGAGIVKLSVALCAIVEYAHDASRRCKQADRRVKRVGSVLVAVYECQKSLCQQMRTVAQCETPDIHVIRTGIAVLLTASLDRALAL